MATAHVRHDTAFDVYHTYTLHDTTSSQDCQDMSLSGLPRGEDAVQQLQGSGLVVDGDQLWSGNKEARGGEKKG